MGVPCTNWGCHQCSPLPSRALALHKGASRTPAPPLQEINAVKRAFNGLIDWRPLSCSNTCFLQAEAASPVLFPVDGCQARPAGSVRSSTGPSLKSISPFKLRDLSSPWADQTWDIGAEAGGGPARVGRLRAVRLEHRGLRGVVPTEMPSGSDFAGGGRTRRRGPGARAGVTSTAQQAGLWGTPDPTLGLSPLAGGTKTSAMPAGFAARRRVGTGVRCTSSALGSLMRVYVWVAVLTQSRPSVSQS